MIRLILGIDAQAYEEMNLVICQVPVDREKDLVDFIAQNNLELGTTYYFDVKRAKRVS